MGRRCNVDLSLEVDLDCEFLFAPTYLGYLLLYLFPLFFTSCEIFRYQILHS
jgi:hypothetical protein